MAVRIALVLLLLACLVSLAPLAYASPPDPTWTEGFFDDLDFDDVVVSVSSAAWAVELAPLTRLTPVSVSVRFIQPGEQPVRSTAALPTFLGRAPPVA